jgi:uncharacterized BrkB/YihY/UPF0761 family membrane protein
VAILLDVALFMVLYIMLPYLVYGPVAAIIAILTWTYLSDHIFLFGVYLSVSNYHLKQQQQEAAGQLHQ